MRILDFGAVYNKKKRGDQEASSRKTALTLAEAEDKGSHIRQIRTPFAQSHHEVKSSLHFQNCQL